jgi:hypothetical protein
MTNIEVLLGSSAIVVAVIGYLSRYRVIHIQRQQTYLRSFYTAAGRIIDDDNTPDNLVKLILSLSSKIMSKRLSPEIAWEGLLGHFWEPDSNKSNLSEKILRTTTCLPIHLRRDWSEARASFILAVTYNSVITGTFVRRLMLISLREKQPPEDEDNSHNYEAQNLNPIIANIAARDDNILQAAA